MARRRERNPGNGERENARAVEEGNVSDDGKVIVLFDLFRFRMEERKKSTLDGAIWKIKPARVFLKTLRFGPGAVTHNALRRRIDGNEYDGGQPQDRQFH